MQSLPVRVELSIDRSFGARQATRYRDFDAAGGQE
jgi:hypothetical protein